MSNVSNIANVRQDVYDSTLGTGAPTIAPTIIEESASYLVDCNWRAGWNKTANPYAIEAAL